MPAKFQRSACNTRMEVASLGTSSVAYQGPRATQKSISNQRQTQTSQESLDNDDESITQIRRRAGDSHKDEENHVLGTLIKFLLTAAVSKNAIKHSDIKNSGLADHGKHYQNFMAKAKGVLNEVFGYTLMNITGQKWIIVNAHPEDEIRLQPEDPPGQTLLFLVLSHIFMSGGNCKEDNLIQFLKNLKIWRGPGGYHPYFGNVDELLQKKFTRQVYIIRSKVPDTDHEIYQYTWGERATEELDPQKVLRFISKVFRNRPVHTWPKQYQQVYGDDDAAA